jgi:hypothetical protein
MVNEQTVRLMYKILGQDGKEYGPVDVETLRRWISEGRVNAQTQAQAEGSTDWRPLTEFPELEGLLAGSGPPSPPPPQPQPAAPTVQPAAQPQRKALAIVSLVLGILSLVTCFLAGIPAIITGAIAQSRSRRDPARYGGRGLALAGLILGCCGTALTAIVVLALPVVLPAVAKGKSRAETIRCVGNLKLIGLAARMYAQDHNGVLPRDFITMSNELPSPKVLVCPADRTRQAATEWADFSADNVSYEFLAPGAKQQEVMNQPVFRCPIHDNVCYGDGSVQQGQEMPPPRLRPRR